MQPRNMARQTLRFENRWNGLNNTNCHNPANWSCCQVPDGNTDVKVSGFKVLYPQVLGNAEVRSITVPAKARLQ